MLNKNCPLCNVALQKNADSNTVYSCNSFKHNYDFHSIDFYERLSILDAQLIITSYCRNNKTLLFNNTYHLIFELPYFPISSLNISNLSKNQIISKFKKLAILK